jgi:hypothetical protein
MPYQLMRDENGQYWRWGVDASGGAGNETPILIPSDAPVSEPFTSYYEWGVQNGAPVLFPVSGVLSEPFAAADLAICNLALSHLGDTAELESFNDSTPQAIHCKRFYPIARNALLEQHQWSFATVRAALTPAVYNPSPSWLYAYNIPEGALKLLEVLPAGVDSPLPQPFTLEDDGTGHQIILTNTPEAVLRYSRIIPDATTFTPLFTVALSWSLASMLAGPIIQGDQGQAESKRCLLQFQLFKGQAETSDANRGRPNITHTPAWISGR